MKIVQTIGRCAQEEKMQRRWLDHQHEYERMPLRCIEDESNGACAKKHEPNKSTTNVGKQESEHWDVKRKH